jgi:hypothetical protein
MNKVIANFLVLFIIIELILLSMQAEIVTAIIGYVLAALLSLALLVTVTRKN